MSHPVAPVLVVITGAPATGKTTLGRQIGHDFALPFFSKDDVKDRLFDALGWSDREWSRKMGSASFQLLFAIAEAQLAAGRSLILEANFRPDFDTPRFFDLIARYPCAPFQVYCDAAPDTILSRFQARWEAGARHPGHAEHEQMTDFVANHLTPGAYAPLAIGGALHMLDTTDLARLDVAPIYAALRAALDGAEPG